MLKYVVCLCKGCDGCCVFCLYCDAWSCKCSCIGSMSVSSCRCMFVSCVHPVAVLNSAFCMTCSLLMLVEDERRPYGSGIRQSRSHDRLIGFGSKVRPRTFGCVAMGSAVLFIFRSRLILYSAGSGVNLVQVVLSGFSVRLFCFVQAKTLCRYGCMYILVALVLVCVDVMVMSSA